jgi:hypothetical protein
VTFVFRNGGALTTCFSNGFLKAKDGTVKDWDGNGAQLPADF